MLLNLDAGERDDESEELWALFDVLNVACGGHAGDAGSMARLVRFGARTGVRIGAHPSYPDRDGFGRRSLELAPAELTAAIAGQCEALLAIARQHGVAVTSIKPHGALYHDAAASKLIADAVLRGAIDVLGRTTRVIGPPRGALRTAAEQDGLTYLREGFADRGLRPDGGLVARGQPGDLITDPAAAAAQARSLRDVETICVHADTPGAVAIARAVREAIRD
jgi:UPF0271 protein